MNILIEIDFNFLPSLGITRNNHLGLINYWPR